MGTVSGVLHVIPSDFIKKIRFMPDQDEDILNQEKEILISNKWIQMKQNDYKIIELLINFENSKINLKINNKSLNNLNDFALAINKNILGLTLPSNINLPENIDFNSNYEISFPILFNNNFINLENNLLQIALKTNQGTIIGNYNLPLEYSLIPQNDINIDIFRSNFINFNNKIEFILNDFKFINY